MMQAFIDIGFAPDIARVRTAEAHVRAVFDQRWKQEQRTMSAAENLDTFWSFLGIAMPADLRARVIEAYEDSIHHGMPQLLAGSYEAIHKLSGSYKLALISDTSFSPGRVLRDVLEIHGLLACFSATVFSDETGVAKPHPLAYTTALSALGASPGEAVHIGDIERTDIAGANGLGMRSILLRLDRDSEFFHEHDGTSAADAVVDTWEEAIEAIDRFDGEATPDSSVRPR
jgi:putative hydrolase of the HAD superfamily